MREESFLEPLKWQVWSSHFCWMQLWSVGGFQFKVGKEFQLHMPSKTSEAEQNRANPRTDITPKEPHLSLFRNNSNNNSLRALERGEVSKDSHSQGSLHTTQIITACCWHFCPKRGDLFHGILGFRYVCTEWIKCGLANDTSCNLVQNNSLCNVRTLSIIFFNSKVSQTKLQ